jgi:hypothetical protein
MCVFHFRSIPTGGGHENEERGKKIWFLNVAYNNCFVKRILLNGAGLCDGEGEGEGRILGTNHHRVA